MRILIPLLMLLLAGCVPATLLPTPTLIPMTLSPQIQHAYDLLRRAGVFSGPAVGVAGTTPDTVMALRTIVAEPHAEKILQNLLNEAELPGQLYALAGLYVLDPAHARVIAPKYLVSNESIATTFGCVNARDTVANVAREIMDGSLARALAKPEP